jgi:hypothetical protein
MYPTFFGSIQMSPCQKKEAAAKPTCPVASIAGNIGFQAAANTCRKMVKYVLII